MVFSLSVEDSVSAASGRTYCISISLLGEEAVSVVLAGALLIACRRLQQAYTVGSVDGLVDWQGHAPGPDGWVIYGQRAIGTFYTKLDLHKFPFDRQVCAAAAFFCLLRFLVMPTCVLALLTTQCACFGHSYLSWWLCVQNAIVQIESNRFASSDLIFVPASTKFKENMLPQNFKIDEFEILGQDVTVFDVSLPRPGFCSVHRAVLPHHLSSAIDASMPASSLRSVLFSH